MAVTIQFPGLGSGGYVESPPGYFTFPDDLVEDPSGSGLYIPAVYLLESDGLYDIPSAYIGSGSTSTTNIKSFSVQEDATPIDPSSSFGGVGQITFALDDFPDAKLLLGEIVLSDGSRGKTSGAIRSLDAQNGALSVVADSALGLFNSDHIVPPLNTTLGSAIQYYCDVVGIQNDVVVDSSIASRAVVYPGWNGNMWVYLKQLLAKEQVEMALVFNRISVRPLRLLTANTERETDFGWSADNRTAAKKVQIYYYNHVYGTQQEVYPLLTEDVQPTVVDAGETITFTQQLNASMVSVNQPTCIDFVEDRPYPGTNGVYAVSGNDGLPVTAAQWTAQGGSVRVKITDDPSIIEVTVTGANMTDYAPYRIAMSSGSSNYYNALHITGTGVLWDKKLVTLTTGATNAVTGEDIGVTVDNPFISTLAQAYSLGAKVSAAYSGTTYTVSGNAFDINRNGAGRALIQATIADFNEEVIAGTTIAEFNIDWAGQTIANFNEYWAAKVDLLWENQMFGNAPGARILTSDANFRINSSTTTESSVQFSADLDTLISDFNPLWTGETIADFNIQFAAKTMKDFAMIPLRRN